MTKLLKKCFCGGGGGRGAHYDNQYITNCKTYTILFITSSNKKSYDKIFDHH